MSSSWLRVLPLGATMAAAPVMAHADIVFATSGTQGGNSVAASADFSIFGSDLTITLQNTSPANKQETPTSTLTGISFTLAGNDPTLTPVSAISPNAIVNAAACTINPCGGTNVNVGGEWGYQTTSKTELIGSAGYVTTGLTGDLGNFNGKNLTPPPSGSLDGINFGILSATHGKLNGGLGSEALIQDTVVLSLNGLPANIKETDIGNVVFYYGTKPDGSLGGTCVFGCDTGGGGGGGGGGAVPEPTTLGLLGVGLLGLGALGRQRRG